MIYYAKVASPLMELQKKHKIRLDGSATTSIRETEQGLDNCTDFISTGLGEGIPHHPRRFWMVPPGHTLSIQGGLEENPIYYASR